MMTYFFCVHRREQDFKAKTKQKNKACIIFAY